MPRETKSRSEPRPASVPIGTKPQVRRAETLHLAANSHAAALTRLEMGIMRAQEGFSSWVGELNKQVSGGHLSFTDIALLHCVLLRGGTPTLSDMLVFLHRTDLAALQYSFRKLERMGLVRRIRGATRREVAYDVTDKAREITDTYSRRRHEILVSLVEDIVDMDSSMHAAAAVLERLVGIYDQATQGLLNEHLLARRSREPAALDPSRDQAARLNGSRASDDNY